MASKIIGRNRIFTIEIGKLKVHPVAQRAILPSKKQKLIDTLDLDAIGTIHVVMIDEVAYIVDGQHRWTALMHHGFDEWRVRCELHTNVTTDEEACGLFLKLNDRATVATYDKYVNELRAGFPTAVRVDEIATKHGWMLDRQKGFRHIMAIASMKRSCELDEGGVALDMSVEDLTEAFGHRPEAVEGKLIEALARIYARWNGEVDRSVMKKKLAKYPGGPSALLGDAKGLQRIRRGTLTRATVETIVSTYNAGRRNKLED